MYMVPILKNLIDQDLQKDIREESEVPSTHTCTNSDDGFLFEE